MWLTAATRVKTNASLFCMEVRAFRAVQNHPMRTQYVIDQWLNAHRPVTSAMVEWTAPKQAVPAAYDAATGAPLPDLYYCPTSAGGRGPSYVLNTSNVQSRSSRPRPPLLPGGLISGPAKDLRL